MRRERGRREGIGGKIWEKEGNSRENSAETGGKREETSQTSSLRVYTTVTDPFRFIHAIEFCHKIQSLCWRFQTLVQWEAQEGIFNFSNMCFGRNDKAKSSVRND